MTAKGNKASAGGDNVAALPVERMDASTARRLAVAADCDPRTIVRVAEGSPAKTIAARRARSILEREGWLKIAPSRTAAAK